MWVGKIKIQRIESSLPAQGSGLSWKSCHSWSEFWEIQTLICEEMCEKLLVLTKSFPSRTDGSSLVSNTVPAPWQQDLAGDIFNSAWPDVVYIYNRSY